ncbi:hypothetical protein [Thermococcus sp.]|uniref:hypothetical protein n=1 Tax=Thermococcus sp. TaxID=35749 RepID=UPI002605B5EC|nr:hypothetical protein [Thermococcus sp.]
MKWKGVIVYSTSLFLLYFSSGIDVAITLASVSLSVMYVWTMILWLIRRREDRNTQKIANGFLAANLIAILASVFVIKPLAATLLLVVLLVLSGFMLLVVYGLRKGPAIEKADSRLRWFGVLLLGFFSLNPFIEGISTHNWIEGISAVLLVVGGYLIFEEVRTSIRESKQAEESQ